MNTEILDLSRRTNGPQTAIKILIHTQHNIEKVSREKQAYTWSGCVLKRTKSASTPPVLSLFKRRTSNQAIFFMACPHQDPDWRKRAQLLLARYVETNPGPI